MICSRSLAIDAEVSKLVTDAYARAEQEITENKDKVELLAKTLLERETMDGRDVAKLVGIEMKEPEKEDPMSAAAPSATGNAKTEGL